MNLRRYLPSRVRRLEAKLVELELERQRLVTCFDELVNSSSRLDRMRTDKMDELNALVARLEDKLEKAEAQGFMAVVGQSGAGGGSALVVRGSGAGGGSTGACQPLTKKRILDLMAEQAQSAREAAIARELESGHTDRAAIMKYYDLDDLAAAMKAPELGDIAYPRPMEAAEQSEEKAAEEFAAERERIAETKEFFG